MASLSQKDAYNYVVGKFSSFFPETSTLELSALKGLEKSFVVRQEIQIAQSIEERTFSDIYDSKSVLVTSSEPILKSKECVILILTYSAVRAMEILRYFLSLHPFPSLYRTLSNMRKKCLIAKLFAKHLKIHDQIDLLSAKNVPIAIGTPARILAIMKTGNSLDNIKHLIVDVSRDSKLRSIFDIPETAKPMLELICQAKLSEIARRETSVSFAI